MRIEYFAFNPDSVTMSSGDIVRWTNLDPVTHSITGPDFSSNILWDDDSFWFTFTREGVYEYYFYSSFDGWGRDS